ncbi:MAG TPA: hypothetical protein VEI01_04130 [Terriglobales bacterium]|nr:hypothetical protein [Terriglobales bacterium]
MKILLALICLVAVPFFLRFLFALISEPKPSLHGTVLRLTLGRSRPSGQSIVRIDRLDTRDSVWAKREAGGESECEPLLR